MAVAQPLPQMSTVTDPQPQIDAAADLEPVARAGRTELGMISIADQVVTKITARAAAENPDAGAAVARMLGRAVPGAGHLGVRGTDLDALPKPRSRSMAPKRSSAWKSVSAGPPPFSRSPSRSAATSATGSRN